MSEAEDYAALVDRGDADGLNTLGIRFAQAGDIERAVRAFSAATALGHAEAAANAGKAHNLLGDYPRAAFSFRRAFENGMDECEVDYAVALVDSDEDPEEGEAILRAAAGRGCAEAGHQLALIFFVQDRFEEARETLVPFVTDGGEPAALDTYATILRFSDRSVEALGYYDRAIEKGYTEAHLGRARALVEVDSHADAENAFRTAMLAGVEGAAAEFARWLHRQGNAEGAREVLQRAWSRGLERPEICNVAWVQAIADEQPEAATLWMRRGLAAGAPEIEAHFYGEA